MANSSSFLDKSLLELSPDEESFFKTITGITDVEKLKEHIFAIQEEAYELYPYPCIKGFNFVRFNAANFPIYNHVLHLGRERPGAIFLDIGCFVGNDIRKLISDGFPAENIVATDLHQEFWDMGHKLFKSTVESLGVKFIAGDVFDNSHIALLDDKASEFSSPRPSLSSLTSLNPLRGHVSAIQASWLFHLFDEEQQFKFACLLKGLLDERPGSTIFGAHGCKAEKGTRRGILGPMFCHSVESWTDMWENQVFEKGTVKVTAHSHVEDNSDISPTGDKFFASFDWLTWSVVRL